MLGLATLVLGGFAGLGHGFGAGLGASSGKTKDPKLWVMPVAGAKVVREYLGPLTPYGPGHRGVDLVSVLPPTTVLPTANSSVVLAPNDGEISFAGWVGFRPVVSIHHAGSLISSFEPACTDLPVGSRVDIGQPIAWVCSGKQQYVSHCQFVGCVHWGMRNSSGYFSPLSLLGLLAPSRLLPWHDG